MQRHQYSSGEGQYQVLYVRDIKTSEHINSLSQQEWGVIDCVCVCAVGVSLLCVVLSAAPRDRLGVLAQPLVPQGLPL